jgi:hypothetical protein
MALLDSQTNVMYNLFKTTKLKLTQLFKHAITVYIVYNMFSSLWPSAIVNLLNCISLEKEFRERPGPAQV